MKTKIIFLTTTLVCMSLKAQMSVDNPGLSVDKGYHQQLTCLASTETEKFSVLVQWKSLHEHHSDGRAPYLKQSFAYEIKNLNTQETWKDSYAHFFSENAKITNSDSILKFSGNFFMYKRFGVISRSANIDFEKQNAQFSIKNIKLTAADTYGIPKNYCNPPTRLCGSEPIYIAPTILDIVFENSSCEYSEATK